MVIDAKNGRLKAWVALEKKDNGFAEAKLLKKAFSARSIALINVPALLTGIDASLEDSIDICGGVYDTEDGLKIRDHNGSTKGYGLIPVRDALVKKSNVAMYKIMQIAMGNESASGLWQKIMRRTDATNAMNIAASMWNIYNDEAIIYPTLKGDSVEVVSHTETKPKERQYIKEVLIGLNKADGIQTAYAPQDVEIAGVYGNWGKDYYTNDNTVTETSFAGFLRRKLALHLFFLTVISRYKSTGPRCHSLVLSTSNLL